MTPECTYNDKDKRLLVELENYVNQHVGFHATKYVSEVDALCPPKELAERMQKFMTHEHSLFYGSFAIDYFDKNKKIELEEHDKILRLYYKRMQRIPEVYGRIIGANPEEYFVVGNNRTYETIKKEALQRFGPENLGTFFSTIIDRYIENCNLEPWVAARFAIRLLSKNLLNIIREIKKRENKDSPISARQVIEVFAQSSVLSENIEFIQKNLGTIKQEQAFNTHLRSIICDIDEPPLQLPISREEIDSFSLVNHVMERPFTAKELQVGQQILDNNPSLKIAIMIFQSLLIDYLFEYITENPERILHTFEPFSEIFIPIEEDQEFVFAPNPKLLKILSRNVLPAIARVYIETESSTLLPEHVSRGAQMAKDLRLFQTMIGEFRTNNEITTFDGFISQMCPAMQPFSDALVKVLPDVFSQVKNLLGKEPI